MFADILGRVAEALEDRVSTRFLLGQAAFAAVLVVGTYMATAGGETDRAAKVADRVPAGEATAMAEAPKGDRLPVVRSASYDGPPATLSFLALTMATTDAAGESRSRVVTIARAVAPATSPASAAMPRGVERFDDCRAPCDSRDPMTRGAVPARYIAVAPPRPVAEPARVASATPMPPAPVIAVSAEEDGNIFTRTVDATRAAVDGFGKAVQKTFDLGW